MAVFVLSSISLVTIFVFAKIPGCDGRQFPLDNCSTQEMDILALFYYDVLSEITDNQVLTFQDFLFHFEDVSIHFRSHRVHQASVYDSFSLDNPHVNVSSWQLENSLDVQPMRDENYVFSSPYINVKEILFKKIAFVQRLFSDIPEVRKNVTHIALIFLDGFSFSYDDNRNIPHILEQVNTDIKIFVVVFGVKNITELVHLSDTLLIPYTRNEKYGYALGMAVCQVCRNKWFMFEHSHGTDSHSCYAFLDYILQYDMTYFMSVCNNKGGGSLATIESQEELNYLRSKLSVFVKETSYPYNLSSSLIHVYIGLQKNSTIQARGFLWSLQSPLRYRPLIVDNWMDGKPSGRYSNAGVVWKFTWTYHKNETNISNHEKTIIEGWVDVHISARVSSVFLCEVSLPRRLEDNNLLRITPGSTESFNKALDKGYFRKIGNNIVSVSTHVVSRDFLMLLPAEERQFIQLFDCEENADYPRHIPYIYVCDSIDHCSNRRDETYCMDEKNLGRCADLHMEWIFYFDITSKCPGVYCVDGTCLDVNYVNDGEIDCAVYEIEKQTEVNDESQMFNKYLKINKTCVLICNCDECIEFSQLNDGHVDCTGTEGPLDETIGKLDPANTCFNLLGHYIWAPKCFYVRDKRRGVIGCRDMSHLTNCTGFECPEGYFKCPNTYCIPQHYVLDRTEDCPTGEDEQSYNIEPCSGHFACWNSKICLHPDLVCDGHPECPYQDDEVDCNVTCAEGFRCVSGVVTVSTYNRSIPLTSLEFVDTRTRFLDLSGIDLSTLSISNRTSGFYFADIGKRLAGSFYIYINTIIVLIWSNCNIRILPSLYENIYRTVQELDLSYNLLLVFEYKHYEANYDGPLDTFDNIRHLNLSYNTQLVFQYYRELKHLEVLDLSHTAVSYLGAYFFRLFPNINQLYLSYSRISTFNRNLFNAQLNLQTIDLRGLNLDYWEDMFNGLTITRNLYTDNFQICCDKIRGANIPYNLCHSLEVTISSCYDLVAVNVQRVLLWVVAVLAVLGNVTVIVYRVIWDRSVLRTGYGLFVTNLGISDLFMSLYLFIIAGADYYYRGVYVLYDRYWRESMLCKLAGFLATLSCETSIYFIFLITLDRFLVMKFPFGQIQFSNKSKIICLLLAWIIGLFLALIPIVFKFEVNSSNAMCLGLPLTTERLLGWQYSFVVFIVHNLILVVVIAYGQRAIFGAMSENRISSAVKATLSRRTNDILVAKQLSLVALFNFLCCVPIGFMGLLSIGGHKVSNDVYAWTAVLILPINSAANPVLYTIPALINKWERFKIKDRRT